MAKMKLARYEMFTKYLFSNLCSETGLFETNNVKIYTNRIMIKTKRRGREESRSERGKVGKKAAKTKYSTLLYKSS